MFFKHTIVSFFLAWVAVVPNAAAQPVHNEASDFHPEIFSRFPAVRDLAISPDGREMFFTAQSHLGELSVIVAITCISGNCSLSGIAPFSGMWQDLEPSFSSDGLRLYFASNRPAHPDSAKAKDYDIWYVQRSTLNSPWESPVQMEAPVNTEADEFYPAVARNGNVYFTSNRTGTTGKDDIFISRWTGSVYAQPVPVDAVNSEGYEFNAWVAPDESYMIYTCYNRPGGQGSGDLYISYNRQGKWTAPENLGQYINSKQMDFCPLVYRDQLYFTSKRSGVRNVFLTPPTLLQAVEEMNRYDNGASRLYYVRDGWKP